MTLTFDWFLPTSGDGRTIYGRGHSLPLDRARGPGAADGARPQGAGPGPDVVDRELEGAGHGPS
jgi:hypothetical protein